MYVADSLIFLQLHKTACTHIAGQIDKVLDGEYVGKHERLPAGYDIGARRVVGSIHNPFDWYVSLWGYGCDAHGSIYHRVTQHKPVDSRIVT